MTIQLSNLIFAPEDPIYSRHFAGIAVVPGTLLVSTCLDECRSRWPQYKDWQVHKFTFHKFAYPGHLYQCQFSQGLHKIICVITENETLICDGEFLCT